MIPSTANGFRRVNMILVNMIIGAYAIQLAITAVHRRDHCDVLYLCQNVRPRETSSNRNVIHHCSCRSRLE